MQNGTKKQDMTSDNTVEKYKTKNHLH